MNPCRTMTLLNERTNKLLTLTCSRDPGHDGWCEATFGPDDDGSLRWKHGVTSLSVPVGPAWNDWVIPEADDEDGIDPEDLESVLDELGLLLDDDTDEVEVSRG